MAARWDDRVLEIDGIRRRGGLAATSELLTDGSTSHRLTAAVRTGAIIRVRQGWYGLVGSAPELESAVRVGGRATATTAARSLGLAAMPDGILHVRVDAHSARLRDPSDRTTRLRTDPRVCVHWRRGGAGTRHAMTALEALDDMATCQPVERVVAAVDSAIRLGLLSRESWLRRIARRPARQRVLLADVDPRSESYLESIARFRLRRGGYLPEVQVPVARVGRVDLRIGRLVIELDGWEHHGDREAFERDRRRDAECIRQGLIPLRFTSRQLSRDWAWVRGVVDSSARL